LRSNVLHRDGVTIDDEVEPPTLVIAEKAIHVVDVRADRHRARARGAKRAVGRVRDDQVVHLGNLGDTSSGQKLRQEQQRDGQHAVFASGLPGPVLRFIV